MALGTDLFALYHFENDWTDATGNGNDGSTTEATFNSSIVKLGTYSGNFDGNDRVRIQNSGSDPTDFNVTELTIFTWFYYEGSSTYDIIVSKRSGSTSGSWLLYVSNSTNVVTTNWNVDGTWRGPKSSIGTLTNNAWNCIGFRFSSANLEVEFIINDSIETAQSVTHGLQTITRPVYLSWDTGSSFANGNFDELALYNVLKSNADANSYWNNGDGVIISPGVAATNLMPEQIGLNSLKPLNILG